MDRKKKYFWVILIAFQAGLFVTCSDFGTAPENEVPEGAITVEEAKASFEEQMMRTAKVVDSKNLKGWATNFTP